MAKPEFQCPYRKEYFDPLYRSVYGEEFPGLQSDLLSNKARFLTAGKRDYPGLKIWTHANAAALLRGRIGTIDNIIKGKFGGTLPAWLKESGGKNPGGNNPGGNNPGGNNPGEGSGGSNPGFWSRIKGAAKETWSAYKGAAKETWSSYKEIWSFYKEMGSFYKSAGKETGSAYKVAATETWSAYKGAAKETWSSYEELWSFYKELWSFYKGGARIISRRIGVSSGLWGPELTEMPEGVGWMPEQERLPRGYCKPFKSFEEAIKDREKNREFLLEGIYGRFSRKRKIAELWEKYLGKGKGLGGTTDTLDLSEDFAADFMASEVTKNTTRYLVEAIKNSYAAHPESWPGVGERWTRNLAKTLPKTVAEINKLGSKWAMDWEFGKDIPGDLVGGMSKYVGKYGAYPCLKVDERIAEGYLKIVRPGPGGILLIQPSIEYTVVDTIDLCPGAPGGFKAQFATIPLSQYEATGISGDVPFFVKFSAGDLGWFAVETSVPEDEKKRTRQKSKRNNPGNPGPYKKGPVKGAANPGNPGVNPLRSFPSGTSLGWSEEEVARRAVALAAAPAATAGRREVGGAPAAAGTSRKVTCYQTVDNVTIHTGGPLDPRALRAALERFMRSEATTVA